MAEQPRWYPSKVDWWMGLLLAVAPLACVAALVTTIIHGAGILSALAGTVFLAGLYAGLVLPMRYAVTADQLVVRHGLVKQRVALEEITEVRPTRNPLSSPALSLDRLSVKYHGGFFKEVLLSPADKEGFLAELAERAGLRREGDALVR
jgi:hypothetical protein